MTFNDITSFDYIIALILFIFLIRGLWIGFVRQLAVSFALVGSYWLAGRYVSLVMPSVEQVIDNPKMVFLASFVGLFLISTVLFILIGKLLNTIMEFTLLGWFDRFTGGLLGLVRGAAVIVLLYMILSSFLPPSHYLLRNSLLAPYLGQGAEIIRQFIEDTRVRKELQPLKPEDKGKARQPEATPAPPAQLPEAPEQEPAESEDAEEDTGLLTE